jgi:hypothetical protein
VTAIFGHQVLSGFKILRNPRALGFPRYVTSSPIHF